LAPGARAKNQKRPPEALGGWPGGKSLNKSQSAPKARAQINSDKKTKPKSQTKKT
jgi:hypothetical protein